VKEHATKRHWNRKRLEANVQLVLGGEVETESRRGGSSQVIKLEKKRIVIGLEKGELSSKN